MPYFLAKQPKGSFRDLLDWTTPNGVYLEK